MPDSRTIALIVPNLRVGGVQQVRIQLAKELLRQGWRVDFVLVRAEGDLLSAVPDGCRVVDLAAKRMRGSVLPLSRYFRSERPAGAIASIWPLTSVAAIAARLAGFTGPLLLSEHSTLSLSPVAKGISGMALRTCMKYVNPAARWLVAVSNGVCEDLVDLGAPKDKVTCVYNPVAQSVRVGRSLPPSVPASWLSVPTRLRLLAVGRLKPAKNYPLMLEAVARVRRAGVRVELLVLGDGPGREPLQALRAELGLDDCVHFAGNVADPGDFYAAAGLLLFSSDFEGFGNVIVEALSFGVPVVSTDCRSGPREILCNGRHGELVPVGDPEAFAQAILRAVSREHEPAALVARAADFAPAAITSAYLDLMGLGAEPSAPGAS